MKAVIVLCMAVFAVALATYTDKWDSLNTTEIMTNCHLMIPYCNCVLEKTTKCTREGIELKKNVGSALQNKCKDCTDVQKEKAKEVICALYIVYKDTIWKQLTDLYDPKGTYASNYQDDLKECDKRASDFASYPKCEI